MLDKKYIRYFIMGYLNMYYCNLYFSYDPSKGSFQQYRIRSTLRYLGLKDTNRDYSWLAPVLGITASVTGTIIVFFKALAIFAVCLFKRKRKYEDRLFFASLGFASFRIKGLLDSVRPVKISTLRIPFIKNDYHENEVKILSCVTVVDVCKSLIASWKTIWVLYKKYGRRDPIIRSYSSFEFYLTCCFVRNVEENNRFIYYNTYDRWAFLMSCTSGSIFVQHGKLTESVRLIKVGTPETAYYLNKRQGAIVERMLLTSKPQKVRYRKPMEFTYNEVLLHNGKKNVLLVCWNNNLEKEWEICDLLHGSCNLYVKPHPADKDNQSYPKMAEQYHCVIIPKTGYPHVDVVVSYDSTLADEYEDVDVKVIRYDLLDNLNELKLLI